MIVIIAFALGYVAIMGTHLILARRQWNTNRKNAQWHLARGSIASAVYIIVVTVGTNLIRR